MNARLHPLPSLGQLPPSSPAGHFSVPVESPAAPAPTQEQVFSQQLASLVPELRRRALQLTRNPDQADDLVQDTVERAMKFRSTFRGGSNLKAWAMRILSNSFISQRRRVGIERRIVEGARHDPNGWANRSTEQLIPGLSPPVKTALRALPERLGAVVELVDLQEHSYRETAELLDVPVGTVMSRLHRGRHRLAEQLRA